MKVLNALLLCAALAAPAVAQEKKPGQTEVTWWGHAAFVITTPQGARIAIDPWFENPKAPKDAKPPEALDAILVTHARFDHVGDAAGLAKRTKAQLIGSFELTTLLGVENSNGGNIGGTIQVKDATIHLVEAVHSSGFGQDAKSLKYGGPAMGYVIEIQGGPTLYHAGDTGVFSSMELIGRRFRLTHALLPIGGHFTMDPNAAALALRMLKARTVIPMHFGTFPVLTGTPGQLEAALKESRVRAQVQVLEPGKPVKLAR